MGNMAAMHYEIFIHRSLESAVYDFAGTDAYNFSQFERSYWLYKNE